MGCLFRIIFLPFTIITRIFKLLGVDFGLPQRNLPTMIWLDYRFNKNPKHPDAPILWMKGRASGLIARILYGFGLLGTSELTVTSRELKVEVSSLSGTTYFVTPLAQLTSSDLSLEKPVIYLYRAAILIGLVILGIALSLLGIDLISLGVIGVSASLVFWYWISMRLIVAFSTSEIDDFYGLGFQSIGMGGKNNQYRRLQKDIQHINWIIVNSHFAERANNDG